MLAHFCATESREEAFDAVCRNISVNVAFSVVDLVALKTLVERLAGTGFVGINYGFRYGDGSSKVRQQMGNMVKVSFGPR